MHKELFDELVQVVAALRGENGCPWDKAQTHETLKTDLIEETYEVIEAIDAKAPEKIQEELGDLLPRHAVVERPLEVLPELLGPVEGLHDGQGHEAPVPDRENAPFPYLPEEEPILQIREVGRGRIRGVTRAVVATRRAGGRRRRALLQDTGGEQESSPGAEDPPLRG